MGAATDRGTTAAIEAMLAQPRYEVDDEDDNANTVNLEPPSMGTGESVSNDAPTLADKCRLRWEPVNVRIIEEALSLDAIRRVRLANYDAFDVLLSIRRRVTNVKGKVGWIAVAERESEPINGKAQRLFSGIGGLDKANIPAPVCRELEKGVPQELAGLSVFSFSRALKYLIRGDLGFGEYDVNNNYFSVLKGLIEIAKSIAFYCDNREAVLEDLACYMTRASGQHIGRDDVKELMIALGFGGTVYGWMCKRLARLFTPSERWGEFLYDFERSMRVVHDKLADKFPEELTCLQDRPYPKASFAFAIYATEERAVLGRMMEAVGKDAFSPEHDGFGGKSGLLGRVAEAASPLTVSYKAYPDPYERIKEKAPEFDWTRKASSSVDDYADVISKCRAYLAAGSKEVRANAMTFAKYVALKMRATTNVPHAEGERRTHFEVFCEEGFWITRHRDDLSSVTAEILADLVKPAARPRWDRAPLPDPPPPLNDGKFASSLGDLVLGILSKLPPMAPLDGDHSRGKMLFRDGTLIDWDTGDHRMAIPEDRLGHRMGCDATEYTPPEPTNICDMIIEYIKAGSGQLGATNLGVKITDEFKKLSASCDVLKVLRDFAGSWDGVLWLLRTVARMGTGNPRICEFLYLFGPGSSGKDVVMLIILAFFGATPDSYGCVLNGSFLVDASAGRVSKEAASPFLANTAGKRFVWASEVPQHQNLQVDLIKQFCEQAGAPIRPRKLFKAPMSFRPIGVICATSNFPPQVTHKDDTGYVRRARIWQTTQTFSAKPKKLTEIQADPNIKQRIVKGEFNPQMLWLLRGLVPTLSAVVNPATELEPRPEYMREMEDECAEGSSSDKFVDFITNMTLPCAGKDATLISEFKTHAAKYLGVPKVAVGPVMTSNGYNSNGASNGKDRVAVGFHPERGAAKGNGLKLKA